MKQEFQRFNLDEAIAEWRVRMTAAGLKDPLLLAELEGHLREEIAALVSAGTTQDRAFHLAALRLGEAGSLSTEFNKIEKTTFLPVNLGSWLWVAAIVVLAAFLWQGTVAGRFSLLLAAHIFSLTAGYGTAYLAGGFGIYYVGCRLFRTGSPWRERALDRAAMRFTQWAAALVVAGLVLGMMWSGRNRGGYLTGDPREIGTLCAAFWLVGLSLIQRSDRIPCRARMLSIVAGNAVIGLAWFGAGSLAHGGGIVSFWPLDVLLVVHLIVFVLGLLPVPEPVET